MSEITTTRSPIIRAKITIIFRRLSIFFSAVAMEKILPMVLPYSPSMMQVQAHPAPSLPSTTALMALITAEMPWLNSSIPWATSPKCRSSKATPKSPSSPSGAGRRPLTLPPAPHLMFWTSVYLWSGWWPCVGSRAGCVWIRISWVILLEIFVGFCGFLSRPGGLKDCFSIQHGLGSLAGRRFWWRLHERYNRKLGFKGVFHLFSRHVLRTWLPLATVLVLILLFSFASGLYRTLRHPDQTLT